MPEHFLIIGGGQAAAQAVQTLRQEKFSGSITIVGEEAYPPYQRPPLSKKYLAGELSVERLYLKPISHYKNKDVTMRLGEKVTALEPEKSRVVLENGQTITFSRLLLATGSRVRKLQIPGEDLDGIHYLHTIKDADAIAEGLKRGSQLVIVGAGYIGLEVAAVAIKRGVAVTVLEALDRVMARVVSPEISNFYLDYHQKRGVNILCNTAVTRFSGENKVERVETADGKHFPCDRVIVGIGVEPAVKLAEAAGLACNNGILVDEFARTQHPDIFAAGDCTNHPNHQTGARVRLESVHNAIEQAKTAASNMLGKPKRYEDVPWFWSDQYDLKLQIVGLSEGYDQVVIRGEPSQETFAAFYFRAGKIIAINAINSPREFMLGKKLISQEKTIAPKKLANQALNFMDLAKKAIDQ